VSTVDSLVPRFFIFKSEQTELNVHIPPYVFLFHIWLVLDSNTGQLWNINHSVIRRRRQQWSTRCMDNARILALYFHNTACLGEQHCGIH